MSIKITRFHRFEKGHLFGFADVAVPIWGTMMNIKGCKVFTKNGGQWITLPSREYQNDQGETKYQALIGLDDEAVYKKFMKGVTEAWTKYCKEQQSAPPPPQHQIPSQDEGLPF
jgi:DNA-binding cell septation regulator SpoVG